MVDKVNTNQQERTSSAGFKEKFPSQPCIAIVRNHLDSTFMGSLEVELLTKSNSGNSTNAPGQLLVVKYLSPFMGVTSLNGTTANEGAQNSQRSYGFWGVPPDINSKVLVVFAEGGQGFWIGCIPEEHVNIMTPDSYVSSTYNDTDRTKKLPVVEYNKKVETGQGRNSTKFIKPVNKDVLDILTAQGLNSDEVRGTTSSSSRRELPSNVVGLSSPGPADRRPGAPRVQYGENFAQTPMPQNRLGGTSLVMDDGDTTLLRTVPAKDGAPVYKNVEAGETGGDPTLPHNELFRIRTRTGHQILMHNTEDLIYIANARGTTWVELTANGKIDIYAKDSVNVHSETDINIKADKNINIEAGEDINLKAGKNGNLTAAENTNIRSKHHYETADRIDMNGPEATEAQASQRVPEHEPWAGHENLHNSTVTTPDTFSQSSTRPADSQPNQQTPDQEQDEIDAAADDLDGDGVEATETTTGVPAEVTSAAEAVQESLSISSVGDLVNAVVSTAEKITHGIGQAIVGTIDAIAGPSFLTNIKNVGGEIIQDVSTAAGDLLNLRTTLAKGQLPTPINPANSAESLFGGSEDRQLIADVGAGKYSNGETVTMSNGDRLRVTEEDGKFSLVNFNVG